VKLFVCVKKLILLGHVSENGTTLNVLHNRIGWNKSWWKNLPVVRFAYPKDFRKKKRKRIKLHFERL